MIMVIGVCVFVVPLIEPFIDITSTLLNSIELPISMMMMMMTTMDIL